MKNLKLLAAALAVLLLSGHGAFALSVEQRDTTNSDGTSKFADPDEQTPAGLVSPDAASNGHLAGPLSGPSVTGPTVPQMMGIGQGGDAFDHAYNHLENQNK